MITVNLEKAREIAHAVRRDRRKEQFQPIEERIIPGLPVEVELETQRQAIRDENAALQDKIDRADSVEALAALVAAAEVAGRKG